MSFVDERFSNSTLSNEAIKETLLFKKAYGCMMGGAIGDAFGGPVEDMHHEEIEKRYGKVETLIEYDHPGMGPGEGTTAGLYTDDTKMKHILARAIVKSSGKVSANEVADEVVITDPAGLWLSVTVAQERVKFGVSPREAGLQSIPCDDAAMSIAPVGIVNAGHPRDAAWNAYDVASLYQTGYSRYSAVAIAASVAEGMKPDATIDSMIASALKYTDAPNRTHIERAVEMAGKYSDYEEFIHVAYENLLVNWYMWPHPLDIKTSKVRSFSADPLEVVSMAYAMFYITRGDPRESIIAAANFGRDCDTIAGLAGTFAGTLKGSDFLPAEWLKIVNKVNTDADIEELTLGIVKALFNEKSKYEQQINNVNLMLNM